MAILSRPFAWTFRRRSAVGLGTERSFSSTAGRSSSVRDNCRKVVCIGRNYADHITELNNTRPKQPFFFLKPPSSILNPNEGPLLRPRGVTMHYEIELGLVIGKDVQDLSPDDEPSAMDAIDHYILAIDMTARNVQNEAKKKGLPWSIAKGFDTFLPISASIPKSKIPDPYAAELWLSVNDEIKQQDKAELMLFRIPRILSDISSVMRLEKGDIVLTGTPKGVGEATTGDVMKAGLKVQGKAIEEATMEVPVKDRGGLYEFRET